MHALDRIRDDLKQVPDLSFSETSNYLEVPPSTPTGFRVWIRAQHGGNTVGFEGWHEELSDHEEAVKCFMFGLSSACKLRVFRRGMFDYKWQLLYIVDGEWSVDSETGLCLFPFWRPKEVRELQNDLIQLD